jgi:hypothetical protein
VPGFVGPFSGTTLTYPDGSKVSVNRALASSPNIDSNNNGIPNNLDPAPFFTPSQIKLKATNRHTPAGTVLSWNTLAGSTNCVLYRTELGSGEWQPLTNFRVRSRQRSGNHPGFGDGFQALLSRASGSAEPLAGLRSEPG